MAQIAILVKLRAFPNLVIKPLRHAVGVAVALVVQRIKAGQQLRPEHPLAIVGFELGNNACRQSARAYRPRQPTVCAPA